MNGIDWLKIRNEYINTDISYRKLAEKYKASFGAIRSRAKMEQWVNLRREQQHKLSIQMAQKTADGLVKNEVNRIENITNASDKLLNKISEAIEQLDQYIITNKVKTKTIEYDNKAIGKPTKEVIVENENKKFIPGIIDRMGLKQLTSALRDLKDIHMIQNDTTTEEKITDTLNDFFGVIDNETD